MEGTVLQVSDFIAVLNQTLEFAYPSVTIEGELSELRVSKGRWLYFKLKDDHATLNCFGTIYMLPGPLEDGMLIRIVGSPKMHLNYGFSFNVQNIQVAGEGSLKKAQDLLMKKLQAEGLFDPERKRPLPVLPQKIGLITSKGSAAESDFIKIVGERWGGLEIIRRDTLVQGIDSPNQVVAAIQEFNQLASQPDILVIIRGGGGQDDLASFSDERVVRAVSASRIPTLVGIGHEIDISLAELAADQRASTPTNAAQILVPDRRYVIGEVNGLTELAGERLLADIGSLKEAVNDSVVSLVEKIHQRLEQIKSELASSLKILHAYDPKNILKRGYAIIRSGETVVKNIAQLKKNTQVTIELTDGQKQATID